MTNQSAQKRFGHAERMRDEKLVKRNMRRNCVEGEKKVEESQGVYERYRIRKDVSQW